MVARLLLKPFIWVAMTILTVCGNRAAAQEAAGTPPPVVKDVKTFAGTESGYDSNLDNRVAARFSLRDAANGLKWHHTSGPELGSNFDAVTRNWQSLNLAISWHPLLGTRQARAISLSS